MRDQALAFTLLAGLLTMAVTACPSSTTQCAAGHQVSCDCAAGTHGSQRCLPDGSAYGACTCNAAGGGSQAASSSAGGAAQSTAASSSAGGAGGAASCKQASDCAALKTDCNDVSCKAGVCHVVNLSGGVPCEGADACMPGMCQAGVCVPSPITQCASGDGCCPAGCTPKTDSDCCGTDCFGPNGCLTAGGRCIRFTCRPGNAAGANFCATCFGAGWKDATLDDWTQAGLCPDAPMTFHALGAQPMCGGSGMTSAACCASLATCAGIAFPFHVWDPIASATKMVGPDVNKGTDNDCLEYGTTTAEPTAYERLTVCEK